MSHGFRTIMYDYKYLYRVYYTFMYFLSYRAFSKTIIIDYKVSSVTM